MLPEIIHLLISIVIGALFARYYPEVTYFWSITISIIGGVLVDADHILDYFLKKSEKFDLNGIVSGSHFKKSGKAFIILHSYELAIALVFTYLILNNISFLILAAALLVHLLFDILHNRTKWTAYFLFYRASQKFNLNVLGCKNK